jgi:hypothetical protein
MNKGLGYFVESIILEGVCREFMGTGCFMPISHEYSSDVDVSNDLEEALELLKNSGIDFHGMDLTFKCYECETCREHNPKYPYHVELVVE